MTPHNEIDENNSLSVSASHSDTAQLGDDYISQAERKNNLAPADDEATLCITLYVNDTTLCIQTD